MNKLKILLSVLLIGTMLLGVGCTKNQRAKKFGGTMEIEIPPDKKFVNATWKDDDLWYLTRDRNEGETPETWIFKEESSFGMIEGTVLFIEK